MNKLLAQLDFSKIKVPSAGGQIFVWTGLTPAYLIQRIMQIYIYYVAGMVLLIYLIIGGLQFMLSRGEPKAMQSAQTKITNAIVGFVIVFLAFTIVQVLAFVFGIDKTFFGTVLGL